VDSPAGPLQPTPPPGVDPADATGIRWAFASTDGPDIPTGATADVGINMEQRDNVLDLTEPITITNDANTTVGFDGSEATSPPAGDTYRIPPSAVDIVAGKTYDPDNRARRRPQHRHQQLRRPAEHHDYHRAGIGDAQTSSRTG